MLGIEQQRLTSGMMNLEEMSKFIESHENDVMFKFNTVKRHPSYFKDEELRFIDELLDDTIINRLLAYDRAMNLACFSSSAWERSYSGPLVFHGSGTPHSVIHIGLPHAALRAGANCSV